MGWVVNASPQPLYLRPGTYCIGWVGPRAALDGCGKSHPQDSTPGPLLLLLLLLVVVVGLVVVVLVFVSVTCV